MKKTSNLAASAAFTTGLLLVGTAAVAQDTPPGSDDLEEVIVSSRRHPEPLFESPAAISVLTEEQIESAGVHGPGDIAVGIPNVTITPSSRAGEAFITIRGIAQSRAADSTVAVIIDGVQQGTPEEFNQELYDLESIEVLKGPQGALYGRNAIAGAIVIKTKEPSNSLRAKATVGFGNSAQVKAVGSLDLPLVEDRAGLRVSGFHSANDGYFRNSFLGRNVDASSSDGAQARLVVRPTDRLKIDLKGAFADFSGGGSNYIAQIGTIDTNTTERIYEGNILSSNQNRRRSASAVMSYEADAGTLTFTPSYSSTEDVLTADAFPYTSAALMTQAGIFDTRTLSTELKFTSDPAERFSYIGGAYYSNIKRRDTILQGLDTGQGVVLVGRAPYASDSVNPTIAFNDDSYRYNVRAIFGQFGYQLRDDLTVSGALRYDSESRSTINLSPPQFSNGFTNARRSRTFTGVEPKLTVGYRLQPNVNLYADYSRGFVSGGFNPAQTETVLGESGPEAATPNNYDKQESSAFELGAKTEWFDRRLRANLALFHTEVENLQQFQFIVAANFQAIQPIDRTRIKGVEFELAARPTPGWDLFLGGGYTDAVVREFRANPANVGHGTPNVPEYTINSGVQYSRQYDGFATNLRIDDQLLGPTWFDVSNTVGSRRDSVNLVNVSTSVGTDRWRLTAFARNAFNKQYAADAVVIVPSVQVFFPALPRTYGVEFKVEL